MSSACSSVLTQARSAAYIGCSGSMASGMPTLARVLERRGDAVAHLRARQADVLVTPACRRARPAGRRPPAPGTAAPSVRPRRRRGGCRRARRAGRPRRRPGTCRRGSSPRARGRRPATCLAMRVEAGRVRPGRARARWRGCRARAQASMMRAAACQLLAHVAVLIESSAMVAARSRASAAIAVQRQHAHACARRASSGSRSRPARSARRNSSARCSDASARSAGRRP